MKLTLGFSPCPNDTYIFDAMIHRKVDTEGLELEVIMEDVEALNQKAFAGELDITKLSYHAYAYLIDQYVLLDAGSALGHNCGPLLIAKRQMTPEELMDATIAIPGKYTTANFLLNYAYPHAQQKVERLFSEIEEQVLEKQADAGLIIHENRFTYEEKGLVKIIDLGAYWEQNTNMPIPLGGIVVRRQLSKEVQDTVNRVMKRSVAYAFENPEASSSFVRAHAQEMDEAVMRKHIQLYVNEFTKDLGTAGRKAIRHLFEVARQNGSIPSSSLPLFLE